MKVLILEYALCLRSRLAWLTAGCAAWLALGALRPSSLDLLSAAAALCAAMSPLWAADGKGGFERYAAALPISRAELALGRLALGALCGAAVFLFELAVSAVLM